MFWTPACICYPLKQSIFSIHITIQHRFVVSTLRISSARETDEILKTNMQVRVVMATRKTNIILNIKNTRYQRLLTKQNVCLLERSNTELYIRTSIYIMNPLKRLEV